MRLIIWIKPSCLKSNFQPHRLWSSVPPFSSSTPSTDPSSTRCSTGSAPSWSSCPSSSSSSWQIASLKLGPSSSSSPTWADAAQPSSLRCWRLSRAPSPSPSRASWPASSRPTGIRNWVGRFRFRGRRCWQLDWRSSARPSTGPVSRLWWSRPQAWWSRWLEMLPGEALGLVWWKVMERWLIFNG